MTLGARVAAFDADGRVLLVKQSYDPKWILPGGGVDRGETIEQAGIRELREEAAVIAEEPLVLHGFHSNHVSFPGDHVASFVLRKFSRKSWSPNAEISAVEFFAPSQLPHDVNGGSARRIHEIVNKLGPDPLW